MALTAAQLVALKAEIVADPEALGLAFALGDQANADLLNAVGVGRTIQRTKIAPSEVLEAIVYTEYAAASQAARDYLDVLLEGGAGGGFGGTLDVSAGSNYRTALLAIFGPASETRANLIAVVERDGSRAEELFGEGVVVTVGEVGAAEALP